MDMADSESTPTTPHPESCLGCRLHPHDESPLPVATCHARTCWRRWFAERREALCLSVQTGALFQRWLSCEPLTPCARRCSKPAESWSAYQRWPRVVRPAFDLRFASYCTAHPTPSLHLSPPRTARL